MSVPRGLAIAGTAIAAVLLAPSAAGAATEVGNECGAERQAGSFVEVPESLAPGAGGLPLTVPSEGVLTSWRIKSLSPAAAPARLGVFRTIEPGKFQLVAASGEESAGFGTNTFKTRVAVKTGDRFGTIPAGGGFFTCVTGNIEDHSWAYDGAVAVGASYVFNAGSLTRVPIVGVVEPDVDDDGYGDETQDKCPRSASSIAPCPLVTTTFTAKPKGNAIIAAVKVSSEASVQVFGQVSWQVRGKPKTSARNHGLTVGISAGGPRTVSAGEEGQYKLPFSKPILRRLGRITHKQALTALLTVRTTDLAGKITDQRRRLKLKGRAGA